MKKFLYIFCVLFLTAFFAGVTRAEDDVVGAENLPPADSSIVQNNGAENLPPLQDIGSESDFTPTCAQQVFAAALQDARAEVDAGDDEYTVQAWVYKHFQDPEVIKQVLACPEVDAIAETDTITFPPVEFQFDTGRTITVNYETQPKVLRQRLLFSGGKRALPDSDPSPSIDDDPNVWINTEPAWYGVLVVQHGSLDQFVGPDKNNVISLDYIYQNIDTIYPQPYNDTTILQAGGLITTRRCTSNSAFADNNDIVNLAGLKTVGLEGSVDAKGKKQSDSNQYYVAGDANLEWVGWAEIGLEVAVTVATAGGFEALAGATKIVRAANALRDLGRTIEAGAKGSKDVYEWMKVSKTIARSEKVLNAVKKPEQLVKDIAKMEKDISRFDKIKDADRIKELQKELKSMKTLQSDAKAADVEKLTKELKDLKTQEKELSKLEDVQKQKKAMEAMEKLKAWNAARKGWQIKQRGNTIVRAYRTLKAGRNSLRAIHGGEKAITGASKIARAGMKSGRWRDFLFKTTLKAVGYGAKVGRDLSLLAFGGKMLLDTFDFTETSTGDFTSGLMFKPLGLLSADDLEGQENVINHGMFLMWMGDSVSPADDDAAYLQAMDFAQKFAQDMDEVTDELLKAGRAADTMCNVDIYVVRPIIRNPDDNDNAKIYYLIMNDVPWTVTAD